MKLTNEETMQIEKQRAQAAAAKDHADRVAKIKGARDTAKAQLLDALATAQHHRTVTQITAAINAVTDIYS